MGEPMSLGFTALGLLYEVDLCFFCLGLGGEFVRYGRRKSPTMTATAMCGR